MFVVMDAVGKARLIPIILPFVTTDKTDVTDDGYGGSLYMEAIPHEPVERNKEYAEWAESWAAYQLLTLYPLNFATL